MPAFHPYLFIYCVLYTSFLIAEERVNRIPISIENEDSIFERVDDPEWVRFAERNPYRKHDGVQIADEEPIGSIRPRYLADETAKKINQEQYYWTINNYDIPNDYCYVRAARLTNAMWNEMIAARQDPRGLDATLGTSDDPLFKIIIRYPKGDKWGYHIAACYMSPLGVRICDPINGHIEPYTELEWMRRHAHGNWVQQVADVKASPPPGLCYYGYFPPTRYDLVNEYADMWKLADRMNADKYRLDREISNLIREGRQPYPDGAVTPIFLRNP